MRIGEAVVRKGRMQIERTCLASLLAAAVLGGSAVTASAQMKTVRGTCTTAWQRCIAETTRVAGCDRSRAQCMRTGRWIGPETGKDFGQFERK